MDAVCIHASPGAWPRRSAKRSCPDIVVGDTSSVAGMKRTKAVAGAWGIDVARCVFMKTGSTTSLSALRTDHEALVVLTKDILDIIVEADRQKMQAAISALQALVAAHLDDEERELLPRYARHAPQDAARITEDHASIRRALAELDIETDLHLLRADAMHSLLAALQAHSAWEDAGMYRWATASPTLRPPVEPTADQGDRS